jgi:hypothetical protein
MLVEYKLMEEGVHLVAKGGMVVEGCEFAEGGLELSMEWTSCLPSAITVGKDGRGASRHDQK